MKTRDVLWILTFCGFGANYMLRLNINIAIVEMVKFTNYSSILQRVDFNKTNHTQELPSKNNTALPSSNEIVYIWDEYEQNLILGSYYWMHWVTELPGGLLAHHYGTKKVFGLCNFLVAVLTFFIPLSVYLGFYFLVGLRFLQGFIAGATWPSMHSMVAKWIPPDERGKFISSYLGSSVGAAFTYFVCGYIIDWYGWEYVYYATGALGSLWYLAWVILVYDTPQEHPWISDNEKEYIENSVGDSLNKNKLPIPWKSILTSRAVWTSAIAQWGATGGTFALMSHSPTYLKFIHGLHIRKTGIWAGIPHLARWLCSFLFGIFSQHQKFISMKHVRKLATGLCTIGVGILTIGLAFSGSNTLVAVTLLILATTLQGTVTAGPLASIVDMSPNFSSILQGITGSISVTTGFIYPYIVGSLTQNRQTSAQWQKFFLIVAALCIFCGILDSFWGTSKLQPWNSGKQKVKEMKPLQKKEIIER